MEKTAEVHVLLNKAKQIVEYEMKMSAVELRNHEWHPTYLPVLETTKEFNIRNARETGRAQRVLPTLLPAA